MADNKLVFNFPVLFIIDRSTTAEKFSSERVLNVRLTMNDASLIVLLTTLMLSFKKFNSQIIKNYI
ncbi:MAG TPA: hypothetical protein VGI82_03550, partial [Chitinophagaceae bacterium]